jgi:hypothetical protein
MPGSKTKLLKLISSYLAVVSITLILPATSLGQGVGIEPAVEVAQDGNVHVTWGTKNDCIGPAVSFGVQLQDDPLEVPYYRLRVEASSSPPSAIRGVPRAAIPEPVQFHTAGLLLTKLEEVVKDASFDGTVFYRATCFDPTSKTLLDSGDCVFRYIRRCESYQRAVVITEGPIVANVTCGSVLIRWVTDLPSVGRVLLREKSYSSSTTQTEHEVLIDGLQPDKNYSYHVEAWTPSGDSSARIDLFLARRCRFRTAPASGSDDPFSFAVFCDTRANDSAPVVTQSSNGVNADALRQIAIAALRKKARFAVVPGDLIWGITDDARTAELQYKSWKRAVSPAARFIPFYTGIGNHDAEIYDEQHINDKTVRVRRQPPDTAEEIFRREMTNPTNAPQVPVGSDDPTFSENVYSFDYGNCHFIVLNTDYKVITRRLSEASLGALSITKADPPDDRQTGKIIGLQLEWLKRDLRSAAERGQKNIFLFLHEAPFPNGGHLADSMYHQGDKAYVEPRNEFLRVLFQHGALHAAQQASSNSSSSRVVAVFCGHEHNYSRTLIDDSIDKTFTSRIWQIITGGGGAPFHPQERAPWSQNVKAFSPRQEYCIVSVAGQTAKLRVYDLAGNLIDQADLR